MHVSYFLSRHDYVGKYVKEINQLKIKRLDNGGKQIDMNVVRAKWRTKEMKVSSCCYESGMITSYIFLNEITALD